jgi:DNA-binding GntR family transcriptional regulator
MSESAEPILLRARTSDAVADHILQLLLSGSLKTGDRIDLDALATSLGVSRAPIREALTQLEHDGIVWIPHHRGAFVAAFDASTIHEAFELYALLSGLTSGRVARRRDPVIAGQLSQIHDAIRATDDIDTFERHAQQFRRVINVAAGGPHLRALIRTFRGLVPAAARLGMNEAIAGERGYIADELAAIRRGSSPQASRIAIEHIRFSGRWAIQALIERGVLSGDVPAPSRGSDSDLIRVVRLIESTR